MTTTNPKTRQIVNLPSLHRLTQASSSELDTALTGADNEVTPLYELTCAGGTRVLNIGPSSFSNSDTSLNYDTPPIYTTGVTFSSGTVTFPSASGGPAAPSVGSAITIVITTGNYLKVGIHINTSGQIVLNTGTQASTQSSATIPGYVTGCIAIGYVVLQNVAGTIQNIANGAIYQYKTTRSFVDGLPSLTNGQLWIGANGALPSAATLSQGAFASISIVGGSGSITIDTIQDIRTTATPTFAGLTLSGALQVNCATTKTSTYSASATDCVIPVNTTGGGFTVTLPASAAGNKGQVIYLTDVGGSVGLAGDALTLAPSGTDTINGSNSSISINFAPYTSVTLIAYATGAWTVV
jgi:hypothetical protein